MDWKRGGGQQYARFGSDIPGTLLGRGRIRQDLNLPKVAFENGVPTPASLKALIDAVAQFEGQDPSSVRFNYFKTSDAETEAMRTYITRQAEAEITGSGSFCNYNVLTNNCTTFAISALTVGGAITAAQANRLSVPQAMVPNWAYGPLSAFAAFSIDKFDLLDLLNQPSACVSVSDSTSDYHFSRCQP